MIQKIFPKPRKLPESLCTLLREMYPNIPWKKVQFYEGMPWFAPRWASAIVLPHHWYYRTMCVFFKKFEFHTPSGISTLVHEAMHVQQAYELQHKISWGFNQGFIIYYNILSVIRTFQLLGKVPLKSLNTMAYRTHPMEIPAYNQGDKVYYCLHQYYKERGYAKLLHQDASVVLDFLKKNPDLTISQSGTHYRKNSFKLLGGLFITLPISVIAPLCLIILKILFFLPQQYYRSRTQSAS